MSPRAEALGTRSATSSGSSPESRNIGAGEGAAPAPCYRADRRCSSILSFGPALRPALDGILQMIAMRQRRPVASRCHMPLGSREEEMPSRVADNRHEASFFCFKRLLSRSFQADPRRSHLGTKDQDTAFAS